MHFKNTLKKAAALSLSLSLGLVLFSLPARAQTGTPILVNGGNYIPTSGTTIGTTAAGTFSSAVRVLNGGTLFGAKDWTLSASGNNGASAVYVEGTAAFSGTNLNIHTTGTQGYGVIANTSSTVALTGGTIITEGVAAIGLYASANSFLSASGFSISTSGSTAYGAFASSSSIFSGTNLNITTTGTAAHAFGASAFSSASLTGGTLTTTDASAAGVYAIGGTVTLTNVAVNVAGNLVNSGASVVTLDNVHGTNGANVFNATGSGTSTLNIQSSALSGNLVNSAAAASSTVNIVSGTLTGAANRTSGTLNVGVDGASKWIVNASSTLTALTNQGVVDMHTAGALRQMTATDFTQAAGATLAMTLSGTGGVANQLVTVSGNLTLAGALALNGDAGSIVAAGAKEGWFVLFNNTGTGAVTGGFSDVVFNGVSFGAVADGGTITDSYGNLYTLTYQGNAATGALTGGNDVLLQYVVPEPGAWAILAGGFGLLIAGQRLRRRSHC